MNIIKNEIHTVLGASGSSGKAQLNVLSDEGYQVRAVTNSSLLKDFETINVDLTIADEAHKAIHNSAYVYLCIGLPYDISIWEAQWPLIMQNVIHACLENNSVLVFLDNVYVYGPSPLSIPFDEKHSQHPSSKKGKVRKQIIDLLFNAIKNQKLKAVVGRSADFYGAGATNSILYVNFLENLLKGKAPQSVIPPGIKHTYGNVTDNAKALLSLALDSTTHGQVWHLPVGEPITIEEVCSIFNKELGTDFKISFMPKLLRKLLGIFIKPLKEFDEMIFQFETDYIFSCEKFKTKFPDFEITPYEIGLRKMIQSFK